MTQGVVDSFSLYNVLTILSTGSLTHINPIAAQGALGATCALLTESHLRIAPDPLRRTVAPSGEYGRFLDRLGGVVRTASIGEDLRNVARKKTMGWARRHAERLRTVYECWWANPHLQNWLEWSIHFEWLEHSRRLDGLFDRAFVPILSGMLNRSTEELEAARQKSARADYLSRVVARPTDIGEYNLMKRAFVASTVVRGVYHDFIAKASDSQILHHPLRMSLFTGAAPRPTLELPLTNSLWYTTNLLFASSLGVRGLDSRETIYAGNLLEIRKAAAGGYVDLAQKPTENAAIDTAVRNAKLLDLQWTTKRFEHLVDAVVSTGVGIPTSFVLSPYAVIPVSVLFGVLLNECGVARKVAHLILTRGSRLRELASLGGGRMAVTWGSDSAATVPRK